MWFVRLSVAFICSIHELLLTQHIWGKHLSLLVIKNWIRCYSKALGEFLTVYSDNINLLCRFRESTCSSLCVRRSFQCSLRIAEWLLMRRIPWCLTVYTPTPVPTLLIQMNLLKRFVENRSVFTYVTCLLNNWRFYFRKDVRYSFVGLTCFSIHTRLAKARCW